MPKRIPPTGRQKMFLVVHIIIFAIATFIMWSTYSKGVKGWAYPWPSWITAAWGLAIIGHFCALFTNYEDKGMNEFHRQAQN